MNYLKNLSLEKKFTLFTAVFIVVIMTIIGAVFVTNERQLLIEKSRNEGRVIAESMAISSTNAMLYGRLNLISSEEQLHNYIQQLMTRENLHIVYALVQDDKGRIVAHNDARYLGIKPQDNPISTTALAANRTIIQSTEFKGEHILDVASPLSIASKNWGVFRIGISLSHVNERIRALTGNIAIITLCLILNSFFIVSFFSRRLTLPLRTLSEKMSKLQLNPQDLSCFSNDEGSGDEIGELTAQFHSMVERLNHALIDLQAANKKLVQTEKLSLIGKLSAGLAHEINNPLDGIVNCIHRIQKAPEDREQTDKYLTNMEDGLHRIGRIVRELLNLSADMPLHMRTISINELIQEVGHFIEPTLSKKRVKLKMEPLADPDAISGEPQYLKQVFLNIIVNAMEAMENGGELAIKTSGRDSEGKPDSDMVQIQFIDTGPGISEENIEKIFDPFYSTKKAGNNTGLGLSVSLGIIEKHGGQIEVDSAPNQGTEFRILIPFQPGGD